MAIKTGIGVGAAQVFDTSGLVGNFAKMLQKQQQDEAKFQTEIADLIAKVDTKGVRDADKMEIANMYDATKELYRQAAQAKNLQEKALLRSRISKAVNDINEYAQNSAGWVKKYDNIANNMAQNPWQYDQGALDKFRSLKDIPLTKMGSNISLDPFDYQKIPDAKSRDSVFGAINRQGENFAKVTEVNLPNNKYQVVKIASDDYIAKNIKERLVSMPDYRQAAIYKFRQSNPGLPLDEQSLINNEVAQYKAQYGNKYVGEPKDRDKPKEKSESEKNQQIWEQMNTDAFGKNSTQAIANLNKIAGSKATLIRNSDNSITVKYNPIYDALSGPGYYPMESTNPKKTRTRNGAELMAALRDAGVTGSIAKSFMRLGGASMTEPEEGELD